MTPPIKKISPPIPNPSCPTPTPTPNTYHTDNQSDLNVTRSDKFKIIMNIPSVLKNILKNDNRFCKTGNLDRLVLSIWGYVVPEIKVDAMTVKHAGQGLKFSGLSRPPYNPITVNFTVDNRYDNYYVIYKWLDLQNDEELSKFDGKNLDPRLKGYLNSYSTMFTVVALDEYDKPKATWEYDGAFPTAVGPLNVSMRDTKELETTFTFEFSQLKMRLI